MPPKGPCRFPVLGDLKDKLGKVYDEYIDYQSLPVSVAAAEANACGGDISAEDPIDTFWNKPSQMKDPCGERRFTLLPAVAQLVLILPHSNAGEERVFSLVTKNKTKFRPSIAVEKTLGNILAVKMNCSQKCYELKCPKDLLKKSQKGNSGVQSAAPRTRPIKVTTGRHHYNLWNKSLALLSYNKSMEIIGSVPVLCKIQKKNNQSPVFSYHPTCQEMH